jgi:hypothetical protein
LLLEKAAIDVAKYHGGRLLIPHAKFVNDKQRSFWKKLRTSLKKYHNKTYEESRPVYFPWKAGQWTEASWKNLPKQWHVIDSVFTLMDSTSQQLSNVSCSRVGMFRSDAMVLTPIDIASLDRDEMDAHNQHAAWAPFGKHPVDDRMIHGPLVGIKVRLPVVGSLAAPSPYTSLLFSLWPMERQQEASKKQSGKENRPNRLQSTYGPLEGIKVRATKRFEMIEKRVQFR